ncbi:MAG: transporter substrate-binding domain-containing protein [Desulfobacterales bacterium]|nr:transporter substrate-binding domain-containing protein [Desulfobacterales bacterium]
MNVLKKLLVVIFLLCAAESVDAQETIRLASGEWSPYQSENLKYFGVVSRIVTEAFARVGVKVEYGYFPWKRSYKYAETGEWDGTLVWFDTPERRKIFYISAPVIDIQYVFFHLRTTSFDWQSMDDLKKFEIGATYEYNYGDAFQEAEKAKEIIVQRVSRDVINFKKLLRGRIDIFPNDLDAGYELLLKNFTPARVAGITYHPRPVKAAPHHILFSKKVEKNVKMLELFNEGLKILRDSGDYDQYLMESRRGDYRK